MADLAHGIFRLCVSALLGCGVGASQLVCAQPQQPPYIQSLMDAYAKEGLSLGTLANVCVNAQIRPADSDNVKIMREQNKEWCDAYIAALVDTMKLPHMRCQHPVQAPEIRQLVGTSNQKLLEMDAAKVVLERTAKCLP